MEKDNIHAGHRERMMQKLQENPDSLLQHELLEVLLYFALPRVDTNPLAHKIIRTFGSMEKVLEASQKELLAIDGVGEKTANLIALVGKIYQSAKSDKKERKKLSSFYDVQVIVKDYFDSIEHETFVVLFLDKNHNLITKLEFSDNKEYQVEADLTEFSKGIVVNKPSYAIIAHNHNSGNLSPSAKDDVATKKINLLCEVHGVALIDHIIYSKGEFFSYHHSGRMAYVKGDDNINNFIIKQKENDNEYK